MGDDTEQHRHARSKGPADVPSCYLVSGNLRLVDSEELVDLVLDRYDQLDAKYEGLLPLQRVFIPESVGSDSTT